MITIALRKTTTAGLITEAWMSRDSSSLTVTVTPLNNAPTFSPGDDVTVLEEAPGRKLSPGGRPGSPWDRRTSHLNR